MWFLCSGHGRSWGAGGGGAVLNRSTTVLPLSRLTFCPFVFHTCACARLVPMPMTHASARCTHAHATGMCHAFAGRCLCLLCAYGCASARVSACADAYAHAPALLMPKPVLMPRDARLDPTHQRPSLLQRTGVPQCTSFPQRSILLKTCRAKATQVLTPDPSFLLRPRSATSTRCRPSICPPTPSAPPSDRHSLSQCGLPERGTPPRDSISPDAA